jgi:predicted dehydrogenase
MGSVHATNLYKKRVRHARLVAVVDISKEALDKFKKTRKKIEQFSNYLDIPEDFDFDAVIIAVPHYQHLVIAEYFLKLGKHVLIEKPMGVTLSEGGRFNQFLKSYQGSALSSIVYNQRTNPVYRKAFQLINSGTIGKIQRINFIITDWYRSDAYYRENSWRGSFRLEGGGTLINQCVHQLDILSWLTGMPKSIYAKMRTVGRNISGENDVCALFKYENGAFCNLSVSAHELHGTNRIEIAGEKGRLVLTKSRLKLYSFKMSEPDVNKNTKKGYGSVRKNVKRFFYGIKIISDLLYGQQIRIVRNFTNHILFSEPLIAKASDGIFALELINAIYTSSWTNTEVFLPLDPKTYDELLRAQIKKEIDALEK